MKMNALRSGYAWLADEARQRLGIRILQTGLGLVLLFRIFTEGPFSSFLWGPHGIGVGSMQPMLGPVLGRWLDMPFTTEWGTKGVLFALALGAFGLIVGYRTRWSTLLTLVAFNLIEARLPDLGDGGDNIASLVLIYMLFLLPAGKKGEKGSLSVWLHNVGVLAIGAQLMVLYATSGFMKAAGNVWHHGTALYLISQVEWFSQPVMREMFKNTLFVTVATYTTMMYQIWFPIGIFSRFKLVFIMLGAGFHAGIAVFMGLITFSSVMVSLELFLITDEEYGRIFAGLKDLWNRFLQRLDARKGALKPEYALFIDGFCPYCRRTGKSVERLDRAGKIQVLSFRHDEAYIRYGIALEALERRMHIVHLATGKTDTGFEAVRTLAEAIPLLFPIRPLLALARVTRQGERLYDFCAARRIIVPDARACEEASCSLDAPGAVVKET